MRVDRGIVTTRLAAILRACVFLLGMQYVLPPLVIRRVIRSVEVRFGLRNDHLHHILSTPLLLIQDVRFAIGPAFIQRYEVQQAGGRQHLEYWIPADDLPDFNRSIIGKIEIVASYTSGVGI